MVVVVGVGRDVESHSAPSSVEKFRDQDRSIGKQRN